MHRLSRVRRLSSRLFSSAVLNVMLLLWKGCRVGDSCSVRKCFEVGIAGYAEETNRIVIKTTS